MRQDNNPKIVQPSPPLDENLEEFNDERKYSNTDTGNEIVVEGIDYDKDGVIDDYDIFDKY